ncbi:TIGR03943 family protein [Curtobacterium sp. 'Ferrero']|uniref:TIGR03943 family putative permease subunit n=1 Tax=Curtobacterium sp. 'Ferrero' TaxID=2033654 RepID=UPI000BC77154|nr:TIGR03943 family protein [Curtobacterium sp. 'Ferrero']PCN46751.1 TIGR03943 family protein [Curtobacterium sp. 'Ferrero']
MSSSESAAPAALGLGSVLAVALCTLWLALVGHLDLYINPRYAVFTIVLAALAVPASVAGLVVVARGHVHTHDPASDGTHDHGDAAHAAVPAADAHGHARRTGGAGRHARAALGWAAATVTVAVTVAMLVLPPTTLSARTAQQRSVDAATLSNATGTQGVALLGSGAVDTSDYGVKDWAALIRQTTDTSSLVGGRVELTGFVVPAGDGSFTLTRFVISCCAVDAQPVGLGVTTSGSVPGADQWVRVRGTLVANPDQSAAARIVVKASSVRQIAQPSDPYEY